MLLVSAGMLFFLILVRVSEVQIKVSFHLFVVFSKLEANLKPWKDKFLSSHVRRWFRRLRHGKSTLFLDKAIAMQARVSLDSILVDLMHTEITRKTDDKI